MSLVFFLTSKSIDLLISYLTPLFIPYLGFFPYKELLYSDYIPQSISAFGNFDGVHYIAIAQRGYVQFEQAFFPLYPLLIKLIAPILAQSYILAGLAISNLSFFIGIWIFRKYLSTLKLPQNTILWTLIFLLAFPTSFFFGAIYTEGLFFLLLFLSLYFFNRKKYMLSALFGFLSSLTRFIGAFLFIYFLIFIAIEFTKSRKKREGKRMRATWDARREGTHRSNADSYQALTPILALFAPLLGLFVYCFYLFYTTGDPLAFFSSQKIFAGRASGLVLLPQVYYRYINIFLTAKLTFQYAIAWFEFISFNGVFFVLLFEIYTQVRRKMSVINEHRLALAVFSLLSLIISTFTGTLASVPRYALFSLSFFIILAEIKQTAIKLLLITIFIILHIVMLAYFIQGYFVS